MLKVVEVLAESSVSWEDAAKKAVADAARTLRQVRSIYIENMQATVKNGAIETYRINEKNTFPLEHHR